MKVSAIVNELTSLEQKRDEVSNVLIESAYGEASVILTRELDAYRKKVDTFLDAEFDPVATVIYLGVSEVTSGAEVGESSQLQVIATLGDGKTKDVTSPQLPVMLFRDFDNLINNTGFITSVNVDDFKGEEMTLLITKTSTGFGVSNNLKTQGLEVAPTGDTNEYQIIDKLGAPIGVKFTTDGNEVTADDWLIDIYWAVTGTTYESMDISVASVNETGLVTFVGGGSTDILVRNGLQETRFTVSAVDTVPPETPTITNVEPVIEGVEIYFDGSTSYDTESHNVYVDGVLTVTDINTSPASVVGLVADGVTSYAITMTAVDTSGNESTPTEEVHVTPLEDI